jgi:hypothetical protein
VFLDTWEGTARQHPDDPDLERALVDQLGALPASTPADLAAELERLRARALRATGQLDLAREAADAAVRWAERIPPGLPEDHWSPPAVAALWEAARCRASADPDAALRLLERALARSPSPEVLADALAADPSLERLRAVPGWVAVDRARRDPR